MAKIPVLIAGAGPTGLMAAVQLRRFGIDCLLVDKKSGPTVESRALVVQSRSMEIYQQLGISQIVVENGQKLEYGNMIVNGKKIRTVPFGDLGKGLSAFPYMLVYEQNKNEHLLLDYYLKLGGKIKWNTEVTDLIQSKGNETSPIKISLKNNAGETETVLADYVIGADGAKSVVRHKLGMSFAGDTYENIFFVADTQIEWDLGYEQLFLNFSKTTFSGLFGMKGYHRFRLIGVMPKQFHDHESVTFEDIKEEVKSKLKMPIEFKNTSWFSVYRLHHRTVTDFSAGKVFLAGDSAHIHSPAGGQGMNTGLQDAYNLCWKLALVIKGIAAGSLLETYNEERLPIAKRLVNTTDRVFQFATSESFITSNLRVYLLPILSWLLLKTKFFRRLLYMTVSQIGIHYRKSPLSGPGAGDRVPYVIINDSGQPVDLNEKLKDPCFHLLIFDRKSVAQTFLFERGNLENINELYPGLIKVIPIKFVKENKDAYDKLEVKAKAVILVRPDNYIGYRSEEFNLENIKKYLQQNVKLLENPLS